MVYKFSLEELKTFDSREIEGLGMLYTNGVIEVLKIPTKYGNRYDIYKNHILLEEVYLD